MGAASPQAIRPFVERYLASLPSTAEREKPEDPDARPFVEPIETTRKVLQLPKATTVWVFDGLIPTEPAQYLRARQELGVLVEVLNRRLRNRLREEMSGTYGVGVGGRSYLLPPEHYSVVFNFDAAPERASEMNWAFESVLDTVREQGATPEELAIVTQIQNRVLKTRLQDNKYWVTTMELYDRLGIPLDKIVAPYGEHELTPVELKTVAQRDLPKNVYIHLTVLPIDSTYYSPADNTSPIPKDTAAGH